MPSAVSQIIEQIVNAIVSVWAAYVLYRTGTRIGAVSYTHLDVYKRQQIDLIGLANQVETMVSGYDLDIKAVSYTHLT